MAIGVRSKILRLALALAMSLYTLMAPDHSASHDPAAIALLELDRHAVLAIEDDGHRHLDGAPEERHPGHAHEHDPDDHSHEVPAPTGIGGGPVAKVGQSWEAVGFLLHHPGPSFGIERPPRS